MAQAAICGSSPRSSWFASGSVFVGFVNKMAPGHAFVWVRISSPLNIIPPATWTTTNKIISGESRNFLSMWMTASFLRMAVLHGVCLLSVRKNQCIWFEFQFILQSANHNVASRYTSGEIVRGRRPLHTCPSHNYFIHIVPVFDASREQRVTDRAGSKPVFLKLSDRAPLHGRSAHTLTTFVKFPAPKNACKWIGKIYYTGG